MKIILMVIFNITDCSSRSKYLAADTPKHDAFSKFFYARNEKISTDALA